MDARQIYDVMFYVGWLSILFPIGVLLRNYGKLTVVWKWFLATLLASFLCDAIGEIRASGFGLNPNLGSKIYQFISFPVVSLFFYYALEWPRLRKPLLVMNIVYLIFVSLNAMYIQQNDVNTYSEIIKIFIVLTLSLCYFYKTLLDLPSQSILSLPLFWVCSGWFLSYAVKFIIYSVAQYLQTVAQDNLMYIWTVHNFFSFVANIAFWIGAWLHHRQLNSTSSLR